MDKIDSLNKKLDQILALQSEVLTLDALCILTGWTKGNIYKKTSGGLLPFYKPNGKTIYFKKSEIEAYLLTNRSKTIKEIEAEANDYMLSQSANK